MAAASMSQEGDYDYDSSCCSSVAAPASRRSCVSYVSFVSTSCSVSACSRRSERVPSSAFSSCGRSWASYKPHKANQAEWEAIRRLQKATGQVALEHFCLVRRIGSGDIGNVYLCRLREPGLGAAGCAYAMKVVDREALAIRKKLKRAETEREILASLDHPFLPTLYASFEEAHYSCLVMEFCPGGDLHALRHRQPGKRFSVSSARFYVAEVLLALEYLHMLGVVYRDLKPENVLVRADGHVMLTDFDLSFKCNVVPRLHLSHHHPPSTPSHAAGYGSPARRRSKCVPPHMPPVLSCFFGSRSRCTKKLISPPTVAAIAPVSDVEDVDESDMELVAEPVTAQSRSFVGTHEYLAPEVISGVGHGSAVDWWTLGVFLYELLFGRTPFKGDDNKKTLINILKQPLKFPRMAANGTDWEDMARAQDLISKLLVKDPKKRIGYSKGSVEIKRHDFFKGVNWALIRCVRPPEVPRDLRTSRTRTATAKKMRITMESFEAYRNIPQDFDYF